jgi:hypothetical protein
VIHKRLSGARVQCEHDLEFGGRNSVLRCAITFRRSVTFKNAVQAHRRMTVVGGKAVVTPTLRGALHYHPDHKATH